MALTIRTTATGALRAYQSVIDRIEVHVDSAITNNGMAVVIPKTAGMIGVTSAAAVVATASITSLVGGNVEHMLE